MLNNAQVVSGYITDKGVHDSNRLKELQALPLSQKIAITQARIIEWFNFWEGDVYLSFSGGKDSTVLLDLVTKTLKAIDPTFELPVVFSNTGLEYPEIQKFARSKNATFVTPKMNFVEVIKTYGYPLISKEVSSAIYYARRIRPYGDNAVGCAEREVTRKQRSSEQNFLVREQAVAEQKQFSPPERFKTSDRKRSELLGCRYDSCEAKGYKAASIAWEYG